jgi:5-oxoprolinase (ATP-hydrolysing) subunit C
LALGNALVGNPPDAAALEVTLKGPRLRADTDVGYVVFGAGFELHCHGCPIKVGHTFTLRAGQVLRFGTTSAGVRAYLCVRGGFDEPGILGSRSGLTPVKKGDVLPCASSAIRSRFADVGMAGAFRDLSGDWIIDVMPGLQAEWFDEKRFYKQLFVVTPDSNRMGLRLNGPALAAPNREMTSEPVCPGAIQVTRDGQCIILGVDGQTIGGYPKIAQVIQADLDLLGQLAPGQSIRFRKVSLDEAMVRNRQAQAKLHEWTLRLHLSLDA